MPDEQPDENGRFEDGSTVFATPEVRERLLEALQASAIQVHDKPTVVYGFAVVVEWMATNGDRWLSVLGSDAAARSIPTWQVDSYARELHDASVPADE